MCVYIYIYIHTYINTYTLGSLRSTHAAFCSRALVSVAPPARTSRGSGTTPFRVCLSLSLYIYIYIYIIC